MLLTVLSRLVDKGNTVVVIEHNLDVVKTADWVIDLGPDGGDQGGEIVAEGARENIASAERSYTGKYLKKELARPGT
jgi:excinuclease ABC subunit A